MTAPTPSQPPTKALPSDAAPEPRSQSPMVQAGALALALLLGFGAGITFEQGRHAAAPAAGGTAEAPRPAPAPPNNPLASVAPRTPASEVPASPPPASPLPTPQPSAPQVPAPQAAAPQNPAPKPEAPPPAASQSYRYVIRYEKNGAFAYETGGGRFENVIAARAAALAACQAKGGRNCKFNYAPAGHCIGVAGPPRGPFRVSQLQPDEDSAADDALEQCESDDRTSCRVVKVLCQEP